MNRSRLLLLAFGILVVSWAGPLIRLATEAPPLAIAFWRTAIASAVLLPLALARQRPDLAAVRPRAGMFALSGAFLALHFASWIASIDLTTVAASVLLVTSAPIWVALASVFMGEGLPARGWLGIALAVGGAAIVTGAGAGAGTTSMVGNLLALGGALAASGYLILGRRLRPTTPILSYAAVVYGCASALLLVSALVLRVPLGGYSLNTWLAIIALGVGPQLIGHTIFNFLLDDMEAWKVAAAIMGEPVGSAVIAVLLFREVPPPLVVPGGLVLLFGIALTVGAGSRARDRLAG